MEWVWSCPCSIPAQILRDQTLSSQLSSRGPFPASGAAWHHQNPTCGAAGMGFSQWKNIPQTQGLISRWACGCVPFSHPPDPRELFGILGMNPRVPGDPSAAIPEAEGRSLGRGTAFPTRGRFGEEQKQQLRVGNVPAWQEKAVPAETPGRKTAAWNSRRLRGSSGKVAELGMFEESSPMPVFPEGCPAPGGHPRDVTEWDMGTFSPPKPLSSARSRNLGNFWPLGRSRMLLPAPTPSRPSLGQG